MHSFLSRSNSVSAYTLSVLAILTFFCFLSTAFYNYSVPSKLKAVNVIVKRVPNYNAGREVSDLGSFNIFLQADLNPIFNWNVRQLFVYLTVEYSTELNAKNQVIIWDKIINRGSDARLELKNENFKYYFWDDGHGLIGNRNVTMRLHYNLIPYAGSLPHIASSSHHSFSFPVEYTTSRQ